MDVETPGWQLTGNSSDAYEEYLVPAFFGPWAEVLVGLAGLRRGDRVLDVACGTGAVARAAFGRVQPDGTVTGTDLNPTMLATARQVTQAGPPVEWRQADAAELPFPPGSFDVVCCQQGLQFVPDRDAAAREMRRVLTAEGRAVVSVWRSLDRNQAFVLFVDALERHSPEAAAVMRAPFGFGDRETLRALLLTAGFDEVRVSLRAMVSRFPSPAEFLRHEMVSSPLSAPLGQLDKLSFGALVADVEDALAPYVDDDGLAVPLEAHIAVASEG